MTTLAHTKERPLSKEIFEISTRVIPGGVNSPVRSFPGLGMTPLIAEERAIWFGMSTETGISTIAEAGGL